MKGKPSLHRSSRFGHKKGSHSLQTAWTHRMGAFYILFLGIKKWNVSGVLALSEARTCDSQSSFLFNIKIKKILKNTCKIKRNVLLWYRSGKKWHKVVEKEMR